MIEPSQTGTLPLDVQPQHGSPRKRKLIVRLTQLVLALTAIGMLGRQEFLRWRQRDSDCCVICAAHDGDEAKLLHCLTWHRDDMDQPPPGGFTLLTKASAAVRHYLSWHRDDVDQRAPGGYTPLMEAAWNGHTSIVDLLLEHHASINAVDDNGVTALMWAAAYGKEEVVRHLVAQGAALDIQDHSGETALTYATKCARFAIARFLVGTGANVNLENKNGETALVRAGQQGYHDMVLFFTQRGAVKARLFVGPSPYPAKPLPAAKRWALATTALLVQYNGDSHELLGSRPTSDVKWAKNALRDWWSITDRQSALEMLERLWSGDHRLEFQQLERASRPAQNQHIRFLAWDYCRLIWVAGVAYIAGYLTEEEAWDHIMPAASALQSNYSSWREMGQDYLDGRELWNGSRDPQFAAVYELLTDPEDLNSPWNKNAWDTDLPK